jgi:hypothetical protein
MKNKDFLNLILIIYVLIPIIISQFIESKFFIKGYKFIILYYIIISFISFAIFTYYYVKNKIKCKNR